jgi:hypothetical protein
VAAPLFHCEAISKLAALKTRGIASNFKFETNQAQKVKKI